MKNINSIVSHILTKPQFSKISQKKCIMKVINTLPPHLKNAVLFTYTKGNILFIVLNHPGLKMEFHYKDNLIKSLLKQIKLIDKDCQNMQNITNIKYFVSNKINRKNLDKSNEKLKYKERAKGDFEILTQNKELKKLFEKIRESIKKET